MISSPNKIIYPATTEEMKDAAVKNHLELQNETNHQDGDTSSTENVPDGVLEGGESEDKHDNRPVQDSSNNDISTQHGKNDNCKPASSASQSKIGVSSLPGTPSPHPDAISHPTTVVSNKGNCGFMYPAGRRDEKLEGMSQKPPQFDVSNAFFGLRKKSTIVGDGMNLTVFNTLQVHKDAKRLSQIHLGINKISNFGVTLRLEDEVCLCSKRQAEADGETFFAIGCVNNYTRDPKCSSMILYHKPFK